MLLFYNVVLNRIYFKVDSITLHYNKFDVEWFFYLVSATWISMWVDNFIDFPEAFRSRRCLVASKKHHRGIEFRANTSAPLINLN